MDVKLNKCDITEIAKDLVNKNGLINLTRDELCKRAGIPDGSFVHIMGCTFTEFVEDLRVSGVTGPLECKTSKSRANPYLRQDHIINVALELAKTHGYRSVTRGMIAEAAGVSKSLVSRYYTIAEIHERIMEVAVMREVPEIIAQGIIYQDIIALSVSPEMKAKAAKFIIG